MPEGLAGHATSFGLQSFSMERVNSAQSGVPDPALASLLGNLTADLNTRQRERLRAAQKFILEKGLPPDKRDLAIKRAADIIANGLRIFISHKTADKSLADKLRTLLIKYAATKLCRDESGEMDVFMAERGIHGGDKWRDEIEDAIARSHWFFLLLPDTEFRHEWPIYEAGLFRRGMSSIEKLLCIHHPLVERVDQLDDFQAYQSTTEDIEKMLRELFFVDNAIPGEGPIAKGVVPESDVAEDAAELSTLFQEPKELICPQPWMSFIELDHVKGCTYDDVDSVLNANVSKVYRVSDIFGRTDLFLGRFRDLIELIDDEYHSQAWIEGLREQLNNAVKDNVVAARLVPFQAATEGLFYRAFLHCIHRMGERGAIIRFHVVFVQDTTGPISEAPPGLDILETTLRWSYRSWWEVIGRYRIVRSPLQVDVIRHYTESAEQELLSRVSPETAQTMLCDCFDDPDVRERLRAQQGRYYAEFRNSSRDGKMDRAFQQRDPALMQECLDELRGDLLWFLKVASQQYATMISSLSDD